MNDCIFCKIIAGQIPSCKVFENENVLAFLDISPMEKGHVLVIPKNHWKNIAEVSLNDSSDIAASEEVMYIVRVIAKAMMNSFATGANILQCNGESAGQTVFHIHFHVIPRYGSSCASPSFVSGSAPYADDAERDSYAAKLRSEITRILTSENLL